MRTKLGQQINVAENPQRTIIVSNSHDTHEVHYMGETHIKSENKMNIITN